MRHQLAGLAFGLVASTAISTAANAADMGGSAPPVLRGVLPASEQAIDWNGFYLGGSAGFSSMTRVSQPSTGRTNPLLRAVVSGSDVERGVIAMPVIETGRTQSQRVSFGLFGGYNMMMEDYVLGIEADYNRGKLNVDSSGNRSGATPGTNQLYRWTAKTTTSVQINDFGSLRARFGYTMGSWMPFVTGGLAFARISEKNYAEIKGDQCDTLTDNPGLCIGPYTTSTYNPSKLGETNGNKLTFGYALGAGIDMMLTNNIFLRAEVQHLRFTPNNSMTVQLNHARVSAAVKY